MQNTISSHKWQELIKSLKFYKKLALACSGGLDSRLLAYAFKCANIDYKIVHIQGAHIPKEEEEILKLFSQQLNIEVEAFEMNPLQIEAVRQNTLERCYHCKENIFSFLLEKTKGYQLCDGTNTDDLTVYRPGLKALKELKILSPFVDVGISKSDIRQLAKTLDLPFADQPSQACLITRFNYGISPTEKDLIWLDKAERLLGETIKNPFRLRCVAQNTWELHIEAENDNQLINSIKDIEKYIQDNLNSYPIYIKLVPSLRGYFDKAMVNPL